MIKKISSWNLNLKEGALKICTIASVISKVLCENTVNYVCETYFLKVIQFLTAEWMGRNSQTWTYTEKMS